MKIKNEVKCEALLTKKYVMEYDKKSEFVKCSLIARYRLHDVKYCGYHASLRLLNDAKLEGKIEVL